MDEFTLYYVTATKCVDAETFTADSLVDAARRHVEAYRNKRVSFALAMRGPDGSLYSCRDSQELCAALPA
jgi:hypothetical protein